MCPRVHSAGRLQRAYVRAPTQRGFVTMTVQTIVLRGATSDPADDQPRRVTVQAMRATTRRHVKESQHRHERRTVALALRSGRYGDE